MNVLGTLMFTIATMCTLVSSWTLTCAPHPVAICTPHGFPGAVFMFGVPELHGASLSIQAGPNPAIAAIIPTPSTLPPANHTIRLFIHNQHPEATLHVAAAGPIGQESATQLKNVLILPPSQTQPEELALTLNHQLVLSLERSALDAGSSIFAAAEQCVELGGNSDDDSEFATPLSVKRALAAREYHQAVTEYSKIGRVTALSLGKF